MFIKTDYITDHEENFKKFQKGKVIAFSNHNAIKKQLLSQKTKQKTPTTGRSQPLEHQLR